MKINNCTYLFHLLRPPKNGPIRAEWIRVVGANSPNVGSNFQVCNLHFSRGQINRKTAGQELKLTPCAVPDIFDLNNVTENNADQSQSTRSSDENNQEIEPSYEQQYRGELKKRLDLEIQLIKAREQVEKLTTDNSILKSKNAEHLTERSSRNTKIGILIANLSVCEWFIISKCNSYHELFYHFHWFSYISG